MTMITKKLFTTAILATAALAVPGIALADRHDDHRGPEHEYDTGRVNVEIRAGEHEYLSAYAHRPIQVWVAPVYQTVTQRVWVPEMIQTVTDRTWVPDRYDWREIEHGEGWRHWVTRDYVLVEPGHYVDVPRQTIMPAHYEDQAQQILVTPGHWETRMERIAMAPPPGGTQAHIDLRFPIHW